jgi:hypothetical protein
MRKYERPMLRSYGDIRKLTQGGVGPNIDGGQGLIPRIDLS